ncbi:MAG TPA: hypothetical protein VFU86_00895 [Terriglobales bacterium]|nr:hypothetical protein [Terriglobales bacterium]
MSDYFILTNRKRAIIALVHSVFFLLVALIQTASAPMQPVWIHIHTAFGATIALLTIYLIVTAVLLVLTWFSCCSLERLYFAFCSASASAGLFRILFGDPPLHIAGIARVLMLGLAVFTGFVILREHSEPSGNLEVG